jgi:hypothetical protein
LTGGQLSGFSWIEPCPQTLVGGLTTPTREPLDGAVNVTRTLWATGSHGPVVGSLPLGTSGENWRLERTVRRAAMVIALVAPTRTRWVESAWPLAASSLRRGWL